MMTMTGHRVVRGMTFTLVVAVAASSMAMVCSFSSPTTMTRTHRFVSALRSASVLSNEPKLQMNSDDNASTTAQLLASLWDMIVSADEMERGEERTVLFPQMARRLGNPEYMVRIMNHFEVCKDVCDDFGIANNLLPFQNQNRVTIGFTIKSYDDPVAHGQQAVVDDTGGYKFHDDDFWDNDFEIDLTGLYDDDDDDEDDNPDAADAVGLLPLPDDEGVTDDEMIAVTKDWVNTMMSNMGICPFTSGPDLAGLPLGQVYYTVDRVDKTEHVYRSYYHELVRMEGASEKDLSTTLLILPNYSLHNVELFENLGTTLTQPLEPLALEELTQLVFFHPRWTFRDGSNRGGGAAANYARRSSWPMINLLRTTQVRAAQRGIPTGLVYTQNEKTLSKVGGEQLERMLCERKWDDLSETKVNRREHDALALARDMQSVDTKEQRETLVQNSLATGLDQNAAVNKVDQTKIDQGDLVNVLRQALEKRMGGTTEQQQGSRLTGAETSAAMMASGFLLKELKTILKRAE